MPDLIPADGLVVIHRICGWNLGYGNC